ncbi:MAG: TonB-dependent receptor [Proteobacteria bacterium]|nr:TonB-dependent receptor [Pseudomonadota bacterium]
MKKRFVVAASVLSVSCPAGYALGADAAGDQLQEVVVTAQKREQRLKDVPISIVAVGADELKDRQITSMEDLPNAVPGLGYTSAGNSHYIEIRGISDIVGSSSLIGIYIDDTDVTLGGAATVQANPITYDLERVEVLRGPQGTLYGEGSAGGTVRFISKNPNLSTFAFDSNVAAMFTQYGDPSQRINAMVNVPLIDGQVGLRVAGTFQHDGGWIDQPAAQRDNINAQDLTNVRIKGLWQPSSQLSIVAMAIINRNTRGMDFSDSGAPEQFTQVFGLTTSPRVKNNYDLFSLTATYDIASVARISNTLGYVRAVVPQWSVPAYFQTTAQLTPGTVADYYVPLQDISDHLLTDELRLASAGTGPWQWTVGGFFRRYTDAVSAPVNYYGFPGPASQPLPDPYSSEILSKFRSWSAFLDTSYRFWDRLTLGAGVRSFQETQHFSDFVGMTQQSGTFHSVDPRVYAQFKLTPEVNLYTSAAKGFRSGGFNQFEQPQYQPENVWTYELGSKMSFPDARVDIDADVFLTNYSDYQTFAPLPGAELVSAIRNVGHARIKGIEADASWRPLAHWRLDMRGNYLNARFTEVAAESTAYIAGDPVDLVPRYQFAASAQHDYMLWGKTAVSRLDFTQQGPATYRNRSSGPWYYNESDIIQMLNFNTSLEWSNNLTLGVFARNLLNDQGFTNPYSIIGNGVRSRPRTVGVEFTASFE